MFEQISLHILLEKSNGDRCHIAELAKGKLAFPMGISPFTLVRLGYFI